MSDGTHPGEPVPDWPPALAVANMARATGRPLLFGLRLWASVCLALYVAFWLELDNAYWAGTSAAIVCQPHLGASLRKGWFRMIGTVVGAVVIVVLTAVFPQNRFGFLVGLALWGGACALVATLLRNFASYAAALAGYTAAIVASDQLGATGGPNGQAFMLAVYRVSEIWIGIVSAGIVLAGTDLGDAPRRLAAQFAAVAAEIAKGFSSSLALAGLSSDTLQPVRRELIRRVIALDPITDEALGEFSRLRYHSPLLQGAIDGFFYALAAWRSAVVQTFAPAKRCGSAGGECNPAQHPAGAAVCRPGRPDHNLDRKSKREAGRMGRGGPRFADATDRLAVAPAACRVRRQLACRLRGCSRWTGVACGGSSSHPAHRAA